MPKSNSMKNGMMLLFFNNTDFANIGDAAGLQNSAVAGNLYVSLHTGDPGAGGSQTTNEANYTGYARVAVARSGAGWTVVVGAVTNAAAVTFDPCTAGSNTITHFGIGTDPSGAGTLLYSGTLTAPLAVSAGITPNFPAGDIDITES